MEKYIAVKGLIAGNAKLCKVPKIGELAIQVRSC
jgi:hypothetical protein